MSRELNRLPFSFYDRDCEVVAVELLGKLIVRQINSSELICRIVETEAYLGPHDLAAHSSKGRTKRTEILFGSPGRVYMYLIYGLHYMLNITARGEGSAVLIRAAEPVLNISANLSGPGLVAKGLRLDKSQYGLDLTVSNEMYIVEDGYQVASTSKSPRVGVDYAGEWKDQPLRFMIVGNKYVSRS